MFVREMEGRDPSSIVSNSSNIILSRVETINSLRKKKMRDQTLKCLWYFWYLFGTSPTKFLDCGQRHWSRPLIPKLPSVFLSWPSAAILMKMLPWLLLRNLDKDGSGLFLLSGVIGCGDCYNSLVGLSKGPLKWIDRWFHLRSNKYS